MFSHQFARNMTVDELAQYINEIPESLLRQKFVELVGENTDLQEHATELTNRVVKLQDKVSILEIERDEPEEDDWDALSETPDAA